MRFTLCLGIGFRWRIYTTKHATELLAPISSEDQNRRTAKGDYRARTAWIFSTSANRLVATTASWVITRASGGGMGDGQRCGYGLRFDLATGFFARS